MTGWSPPHRTAQQKAAARSPLARKVDRGQLAPAVTVPPVVCGDCGCPRIIHRDNRQCLRVGCGCAAYTEVGGV